jgi:hypothetical protein
MGRREELRHNITEISVNILGKSTWNFDLKTN